ncbi:MAG: hypothetical protein HYY24_09885 [Verrucomicrobia bacterium]|nr:hypothetical protein [Verrucomicrobiota bacterium]
MATPVEDNESDAEKRRAEHFVHKQKWKEHPGNRYTAEQLRLLSEAVGPITISEEEPDVMRLG